MEVRAVLLSSPTSDIAKRLFLPDNNQVCEGQKNGFSSDFIAIEIKSPDCPDLTLIDLPGIVRTAVTGQSQGVITEVGARERTTCGVS